MVFMNGGSAGAKCISFSWYDRGVKRECEQEESKNQAADEIIEYSDTFNKLGFTGLSMKNSTPDEIGAVVGTVSNVNCTFVPLSITHRILFFICMSSLF